MLKRDSVKPYGEQINVGGIDSTLASLYRVILQQLGVTHAQFDKLMNRFLTDKRNLIPQNVKERSSVRGNLRKELLKSTMTWKVFCKGLIFINIKKFTISVQLHHANGKITEHNKTVVLDDTIHAFEEANKEPSHDSE